ncbi:MAG: branched-chain amino acid aminotransferase [Gammaproteobacteria bacterium]|jgi:branched-chain amino acid aminotransferase
MVDSTFSSGCAWINGNFMPIEHAAIPITDTGFTRSDVTYDVVSVWNGKFFRLDAHLDRFERNWNLLRMQPTLGRDEIRDVLHACVAKSGLREAYVEMIMTRGVALGGSRDTRTFQNRFYAFAIPYVWIANPQLQAAGVNVAVATKVYRTPSTSVDPTVKNFQWGDLVRGLFEAYDREAYTAILLDSKGNVTEGPGFNVFAYCDGVLLTPESGVLQGITRATILELAESRGIPCAIKQFDLACLSGADEIFLTSTAGGVMPVSKLDETRIGNGTPGPITMRLRELYWHAHERADWSCVVNYTSDKLESIA